MTEQDEWMIEYNEGWDKYFNKFEESIQIQIFKKINQIKSINVHRRLHKSRYSVEEVGQYRICFIINEETKTKSIHFIGNHKQYEKWYKE